ncbi:MAG: NADH-quinone oxidoreductase subunit C [Pseudomonadota bacterium]
MADIDALHARINERFAKLIDYTQLAIGEITMTLSREHLLEVALALRDETDFAFNLLADVCGVDYLYYGRGEWETEEATTTGFERGVDRSFMTDPASRDARNAEFGGEVPPTIKPRFAAVYHLLSLKLNQRVRLRVPLEETDLVVPSVMSIWPAANWFEREAFDLFGIQFKDHPDLRRLLTDYGFVGHPFRKDFPMIGNVEARYDGTLKRVIYEPVSIEPRILEPKVIRKDNRYEVGE